MDLWPLRVESESLVDPLASAHSEKHTGDCAARLGWGPLFRLIRLSIDMAEQWISFENLKSVKNPASLLGLYYF